MHWAFVAGTLLEVSAGLVFITSMEEQRVNHGGASRHSVHAKISNESNVAEYALTECEFKPKEISTEFECMQKESEFIQNDALIERQSPLRGKAPLDLISLLSVSDLIHFADLFKRKLCKSILEHLNIWQFIDINGK